MTSMSSLRVHKRAMAQSKALDAPYLLNVQNGTVDLRTAALIDGERSEASGRIAAATFDAGATCPIFDKFLCEAQPDPDVRAFLARCAGLMLLGETLELFWLILIGEVGCTGRTTWIEAIRSVMGNYAVMATGRLLTRGDALTRTLYQARLAYIDERDSRMTPEAAKVKALTGGSMLVAKIGKEFVSWAPTHTLVLSCKELPKSIVGELSPSMKRRTRVIPWEQSFADRVDLTLPGKLRAEAPGILNWAVAGFMDYQKIGGLTP